MKRLLIPVALFAAAAAAAAASVCCLHSSSFMVLCPLGECRAAGVPARAHLLVYSDAGYANPGQYRVAEAVARRHVEYPFDFAISAGDNLQLKPWPSVIAVWDDGGLDEAFARPFEPLIRAGVRFYAALGNHDHQGFRSWLERRYSEKLDAEAKGIGGFVLAAPDYVVRRNGVKIVFLDVATAFSELNWSQQRGEFARRELCEGEETWTILVFHYPLWSSGEHGRDGAVSELRAAVLPILKDCSVDLVLSGHDHHAELFSYPGKVKTRVALVGNTARPHPTPYEPERPSLFRTSESGFTEIDIHGTTAELSFRSIAGEAMFHEVIDRETRASGR